MADLKFGGITPNVGDIKVGSSNASKIYQGSTLLWPLGTAPQPGEVTVCDLIWTKTNSTITATTSGGNIPIVTNKFDWVSKSQNNEPCAMYWNYDPNNAYRGLLYNVFATGVIQPPTGFRIPTMQDFSDLFDCASIGSPTTSTIDATTLGNNYYGFWPSALANEDRFGDIEFQAIGAGYRTTIPNHDNFARQGIAEAYWQQQSSLPAFSYKIGLIWHNLPDNFLVGYDAAGLNDGYASSREFGAYMRFVKDVPTSTVELYDNDTQTGPTVSSIVEPRLSPVGNSGTYIDSAVDVGSVVVPAGGGYITFAQYLTNSTTPNITDAYFTEGRIRLYTTPQRNTFPYWDTRWLSSNQGGPWSPDGEANKKAVFIFLGQGTYYIRLGYLAQKPNPPGPAYQVTFNTAVSSGIQ